MQYLVEQQNCDSSGATKDNITPLHLASNCGDLATAKFLTMECNSNPLVVDKDGNAPLHYAASSGVLELVKLFIKAGGDPNAKNALGRTPFHNASKNGHLSVMQYLVNEHKSDPFLPDERKITPLHLASLAGHQDCVEFLTKECKCDPLSSGNGDRAPTPFEGSFLGGNLQTVKYFVNDMNINPNQEDKEGKTPLHYASICGHLDLVQYLVDVCGADASCQDRNRFTPLHDASLNGHLEVVKYLITQCNCNPRIQDESKNTPLHLASIAGHLLVVKYLISKCGCNPIVLDIEKNTPLHLASLTGKLDVIKYFLEVVNCNPHITGRFDRTLVYYSSIGGHLDVVKYLISVHHCDPSATDECGVTPLHRAAENDHLDVVKYLCTECSCDPLFKDKHDGDTSVHYAAYYGKLKVVKYFLEDLSCDPNITNDREKKTIFHYACENGQLNVVQYLVSTRKCDPSCLDKNNHSPLYLSVSQGKKDVAKYLCHECNCTLPESQLKKLAVHSAALDGDLTRLQFFIEDLKCDPNYKDQMGRTPLQYASFNGHLPVVKYLLDETSANVNFVDRIRSSAISLACLNGHFEIVKLLLASKKFENRTLYVKNPLGQSPLDLVRKKYPSISEYIRHVCGIEPNLPTKIFVIGKSKSGKSTLVRALQSETSLLGSFFNVAEATPHTIGVVASDFKSSFYGFVQLHDFAGHEEYHGNHELLFQNTPFPVVLIAVNLELTPIDSLTDLHYWCNVLSNSLTHWNQKQSVANVIVIGSHYDLISDKHSVKGLDNLFKNSLKKYLPTVVYNGFVSLDCRKPSSSGMDQLRTLLQRLCRSSRSEVMKMSNFRTASSFKDLVDFINSNWSDTPALTMEDLCKKAKSMSFIPNTVSSRKEIFHLCEHLSLFGVVLLLRDDSYWINSIVVRDEKSILHRIHNSIALAKPDDFRLVSLSWLRKVMEANSLDPSIAIKYLKYAQICTEVSQKSFTEPPSFIKEDKYYFFPSFIESEKPANVPPLSASSTPFYSWFLKCSQPVTPRFLQILFSQLTLPILGDMGSPRFTVWTTGMFIVCNDTTETLVEVAESASKVRFHIRCQYGREINLLKRRSHLIFLITDLLKRNCSLVDFSEYIVEPKLAQSSPSCPQEVSLVDIAKVIVQESSAIAVYDCTNTRSYIDLKTLLLCEPLQHLSLTTLKCFFLHPNEMIPRPVIERFYSSMEHECPVFSELPFFSRPARLCTYQDLHDAVKKISIFTDKNLWEIAGVEMEPVPKSLLEYKFDLTNPVVYEDANCMCSLRVKEGESCDVPFEILSPDEYCYSHILQRETNGDIRKGQIYIKGNSIHIRNAGKGDSGSYSISPANGRWDGRKRFQLDVRSRPRYYFSEDKDYIEAEEGSNPKLEFLVTSNPPINCDNAEHEIRKFNGDPVTRFKVESNCITIHAIKKDDAGKYLIRCRNDDGEMGEKAFEIKVTERRAVPADDSRSTLNNLDSSMPANLQPYMSSTAQDNNSSMDFNNHWVVGTNIVDKTFNTKMQSFFQK